MKHIGIISTAFLFAVFGLTVASHAQDQKEAAPEKHEEAKPEKPPKQDKPAKPEKHDDKQQHDQDKAAKEPEHQQDQQRKDEEKGAKDQQKQEDNARKNNEKQQRDQQKQNEDQQKAAQHEQDQQRKDNEHRNDQHANQPQPGQRDNQPAAQRDDHRPNEQQPAQANRAPQPQRGNAGQERASFQEHRARNWQSEHRTWRQRGGYHGYRIPEDRFRASFGESHRFHIATLPVVVEEGFPRFQFGGFWFALVDPWPEYWGDNWYDTDDCYVTYDDDGYYLEDVRYPGVRLAINVFVG